MSVNLTEKLEHMDNLTIDDETLNGGDAKERRYINQYYKCYGTGCSLSWEQYPKLFQKRSTPQTLKRGYCSIGLKPKYYNNYCRVCDLLKQHNYNRNNIKDIIRLYSKNPDNLLSKDRQFIKDNYKKYKDLLDIEKKQLQSSIDDLKDGSVREMLTDMKKEIEQLKKKVIELEKRNKN